jgi:hypothetical protein
MQMSMRGTYETVYLPDQLDSLFYWYAADAGVKDSLGGDISDGEKVSSWTDFSGRGHNVTQATGAAMPTFRASGGPNGWPCIEFDGTTDYLASAAHFWGSDDLTVIVVMKFANASKTPADFIVSKLSTATGDANSRQWFFYGEDSLTTTVNSTKLRTSSLGTSASTVTLIGPNRSTNFSVISISSDGANGTWFVDGSNASPSGTVTTIFDDTERLWIGAYEVALAMAGFARASISEIIVYSRALSADERVGVEQYLKAKYGL